MQVAILGDGRMRASVPGLGGASSCVVHEFARRAVLAAALELDPEPETTNADVLVSASGAPALYTGDTRGDWIETWIEAASLAAGVTHVVLVRVDGPDALLLRACVPLAAALAHASALNELIWAPIDARAFAAAERPAACLRTHARPALLHELFTLPPPGLGAPDAPDDALDLGLARVRALAAWPHVDARGEAIAHAHAQLFGAAGGAASGAASGAAGAAAGGALSARDAESLAAAAALVPLLPDATLEAWLRGELAIISQRTLGLGARRDDLGQVLARVAPTDGSAHALAGDMVSWLTEAQLVAGRAELAAGRAWPGIAGAAGAHVWREEQAIALMRTCPAIGEMVANRRVLLAGGVLCMPPLPDLAAALYSAQLRRTVAAHRAAPRALWLPACAETKVACAVAELAAAARVRVRAGPAFSGAHGRSGGGGGGPPPPLGELVARADELVPGCMRAALRAGYVDNETRFALFTFLLKLGYSEADIAEHAAQAWAREGREWETSDAAANLRTYASTHVSRADGTRGFGVGCANIARRAQGRIECPHSAGVRDIEDINMACRAECGAAPGGTPGWSPQRYVRVASANSRRPRA